MKYLLLTLILLIMVFVSCKKDEHLRKGEKIERFTVMIDVSNRNIPDSPKLILEDKGIIMLPEQYSKKGTPVKLIIYCHSGGGTVTDTWSEVEHSDFARFFVSLGYAVMDMAAMPIKFSDSLKIDHGRNLGNHVAVRSYYNGYRHVSEHYNIDKKGCYTFCNSGGGLVSLNLNLKTDIPIIAQAGLAALISIEKNAWYIPSGAQTGGEFHEFQNRANIIRLFGMKNITTLEELKYASYEKDKINTYDPYDYIMNVSDKTYVTPYKFFQTKDDQVVYAYLTLDLVETINNRGGTMSCTLYETGGHNPIPVNDTLDFFYFQGIRNVINSTMNEAAEWFQVFGGYPIFFIN